MGRFKITFVLCLALWFALNLGSYFMGPPARVGVSGWRRIGFPFPFRVENVAYTAAGPVVTPIRDEPWIGWANFGVWCLLSYGLARRVGQRGTAWWRGERTGSDGSDRPAVE